MKDIIYRDDVVREFIKLFGCIQDVSDIDEWADICQTTVCELPSADATVVDYPNDLISRSALMEYCSNQKSKSIDNNDIARFPSAEAVTHGRLINASWVINEIHKKICDMCEQAIDIEDCNYCKIEKIKRIIYSAPTVSVDAEWIPVSERLPDTYVPVLVSDGVYVWEDELQEDYEDGKTMYWWDSLCCFDFNNTAWMPRPKPWRKDGKV